MCEHGMVWHGTAYVLSDSLRVADLSEEEVEEEVQGIHGFCRQLIALMLMLRSRMLLKERIKILDNT